MPESPTPAPRATTPNAPARPPDQALKQRYPTALDLRARARRVMPNFAFEYMDGGAGADGGIARNWAALDAVELVPRYGAVVEPPPPATRLFGRDYAAPFGIAPIGGPGTAYPGAETYLARAAQAARVPYTLGVLSGIDIERAAELAPDVLWLQLYRFPREGHRIGLDLVRRAAAAGVQALVLTIDTPIRTTRPREVRSGIAAPFRLTPRLRLDALSSPRWIAAMLRSGIPRFVSLDPYMEPGAGLAEASRFIQRESGGAFTWEEIARYRKAWSGPLILKGVLHPDDAEHAVALGLDGIVISSHGGRQIEALPAPIDVLPAIARRVGRRASIILDSGVRSGIDAARAVALGAEAAFAGKAFLWSLGALGSRGPEHLIALWIEELAATLGQLGCRNVTALRSVCVRHAAAYDPAEFTAASS